jgi:NADH dehydrogenase [ubiquinone] 1 alpha subcomplex assembly factor 7
LLDRSQADWLRAWGIDALLAEARAEWSERAHVGDLAALRARSRVTESDALLDTSGLGGFRALEWTG